MGTRAGASFGGSPKDLDVTKSRPGETRGRSGA